MVDRGCSSRAENKRFTKSAKSRKSSSASSEFDEDFRERLEGRYLGNGLEIRPPSGTHHQQPGSHLSVDTRLSELSLVESDLLIASDTAYSSNRTSASSKKPNPYQVLTEKPNCYITSPFKQGYHVTKKGTSKVVDPSVQLKKVTQDSIDRVRQQFRRPKPPPRTSVYTPRLVKAKLKTTGRPISGSGPSIKQCKGIQAGGHVAGRPKPSYYCYYNDEPPYTRSPSLRPTSPTELHRPESSIHCTSRVQSQLDDDSCSDQTFSSCSSVVIDSLQPRNGNDDDNCDDDDDNGENVKASDHRDLVDTSHQPDATRSPDQSDDLKRSPDQNRDLQRPSDQNDDLKRSPYQNKDELQQSLDKNKDDLKISLDPNEDQKELLFHDLGVQNASDIKDADSAEQVANASLQNCSDSQEKYHDDHSDKVTGDESYEKSLSDEIKSKRGNENCKPFTDGINGNHDNDDEDDDDENRKRTLLGRYSHEHYSLVENSIHDNNLTRSDSGKNVTNGRKMTNKSTMRKESVLGNENKMKNENRKRDDNTITNTTKTDHEMRNKTKMGNENKMKVENQMKFSAPNTSIESNNSSTSTKLFTTPSLNHTVEIKQSNKDGTDSQVHIINSTSINGTSPVMTVHVRGVVENDKKQNSASDVSNDIDFNKVDSDGDFMTYVDDVDDDADDDRIPSAIIWKNLDQLNLSMNASSVPLSRNDFHSKARKVQSAGSRRPKTTEHSNSSFDSIKTKPKSRASSAKRKRTKSKVKTQNKEEVDKAELMRKYLSEESRKFSAELPGYFTEQFNIIQETKSGTRMLRRYESGPDSKALVKYKGQDDHEGVYQNEDDEENESSLYLIEVEDPSSAVFFTMDSTTNSTCDIESISGQTDQMSNDTRELSDDTGFETMPGSGLSGKHDSVGKVDSGVGLHDGVAIDMEDDVKNEQFRFNANLEDLEVVAKAKHLTDPKSSTSLYSTCPFEPLKFTINARPPPGFLYYFAYGVDMNAKRMSLYLRREYKRLWGILFGFKLRFNKKGKSSDAGGFANVEFSPGDSVEGCVYTVTDADLSMLDNCMGYPKHYCRVVLPVWMSNCHDPDQHGVAQYCVPAVLYAAQQQWLEPGKTDFLDCSYSVSQCLKASDILTPNYVDYLNHLVA